MRNAALALAVVCSLSAAARAADAGIATPITTSKNESPAASGAQAASALSSAMTPSEVKVALAQGEKLVEELRQAADNALNVLSKPLPKAGPGPVTSAARIEALRKQLLTECRRGVRIETLLEPKSFAAQPALLVSHQACKAAAAKSMAQCDIMSALAYTGKPTAEGPTTPQGECRQQAGQKIFIAALIAGSGPAACSSAADFFTGIESARRVPFCQAVLSGAPDACVKAAAASGGAMDAAGKAECKATVALRGAASAQACSAPGLPKDMAAACRDHFADKAGSCLAQAEKIAEEHCQPIVRDRLTGMGPELKAQESAAGKDNAHSIAMKAFTDKRAETDALLFKISEALRTSPSRDATFKANQARLQKAIAAVAATLKDFKTASGK